MDKASLEQAIQTQKLGQPLFFFQETDSTNTLAKSWAQNELFSEGTTFVAAQQHNGKGTDGNVWESGKNNLSISILFDYNVRINTCFPLYPAVALAKTLRQYYNIDAHVKWPNDVLVGSKKIAGILCEGSPNHYMITGIGINVNTALFPPHLEDIATSVLLETRQEQSLELLLQRFLQAYENLYYTDSNIISEWLQNTKMLDKTISILHNGVEAKVKVTGISPEGFLEIETKEGKIEQWMARRGLDISTRY